MSALETHLKNLFEIHTEGQTKFTRRMAIEIADDVFLTPKEVVIKLEDIGLLQKGSWDWFVFNGGITSDHIKQVRRERDKND